MSSLLESLFELIREEAEPTAWSRGVELARSNSVLGQRADDEEVIVRIVHKGVPKAITVTLYLEDEDYHADCACADEPCRHVTGAVIAVRKARQDGQELPGGGVNVPMGRLTYVLETEGGRLWVRRHIVRGDERELLRRTLISHQREDDRPLAIGDEDIRLERALGTRLDGYIGRQDAAAVLAALESAEVHFEGARVRTHRKQVTPVAIIEDAEDGAGGFRVRLIPDPAILETFANRIATVRAADGAGELVFRPIGSGGLSERELLELPGDGRVYRADDVVQLVTTVLGSLRKKVPVSVTTTRLPASDDSEPPRLLVDVFDEDDTLVVMPTIVYGDPVAARLFRGRLIAMGDTVPLRDEEQERRLARRLSSQLGLVLDGKATFVGEEAVAFAQRLKVWRAGEVGGAGHLDAYRLAAPIDVSMSFEGGELDLRFTSPGGEADPKRVLRAWQKGSTLAPLEGGGWAPLPADWLARFGRQVADLLEAKEDGGSIPKAALFDVARLCDALDQPPPPELEGLRSLIDGFEGVPERALPSDLTATLRHYQREGVNWLAFHRAAGLGALLADDMGLGKTLQALCAIEGRTLVVAPTSVLHNWHAEAQRFRPGLSVSVYHGPKRELDASADVTLTTYAILRLDADILSAVDWDTAILDEAQAIKNPSSQVSKAAYQLPARFRVTLTGTPVENRLDELWSQFHFINRGLLGGRESFIERYAKPIAEGDGGAAAHLRERIKPFLLRRLKRDVAPELPLRTDVVLRCTLSDAERSAYDAIRAATRREVVERISGGGSVLAALAALMRLRQASCHRGLLPGQGDVESSSKIELLMEVLDEAVSEGHKALVFSQWTSLLDRVEPHLDGAGIGYVRLDGSTRDRAGVVARFQDEESGPPVMLLSLKAGGTGLNLTEADHVFLLDPWWNPAVEDQAADRAHRIGQTRPVLVHRLVAADTVEERILALQDRKRQLANAALGEAEAGQAITRDDLMALLS